MQAAGDDDDDDDEGFMGAPGEGCAAGRRMRQRSKKQFGEPARPGGRAAVGQPSCCTAMRLWLGTLSGTAHPPPPARPPAPLPLHQATTL